MQRRACVVVGRRAAMRIPLSGSPRE